jgi:hypothetical protein
MMLSASGVIVRTAPLSKLRGTWWIRLLIIPHRIVHLHYQESPLIFPCYASNGNNDRWISIQNYQDEDWNELVQLWKYTNVHIAHVIKNMNNEKLNNVWISGTNEEVSLEAMVVDFPRHFKLHLKEIDEIINKE